MLQKKESLNPNKQFMETTTNIAGMMHNVDGEKWSAVSYREPITIIWHINTAHISIKKFLRFLYSFLNFEMLIKWKRIESCIMKLNKKDYRNLLLSLSELLGFHKTSTIDESLLCDQLTLEGALHCITFIIQFGFDLFAVPCASMGIIVCRWCY